jgi:hypothetical protein
MSTKEETQQSDAPWVVERAGGRFGTVAATDLENSQLPAGVNGD